MEEIKIGDILKGSNGHFIVDNIYLEKMRFWVQTTHLESGTKNHTDYKTFQCLELEKCDKKYLLQLELSSLLEKNINLEQIDKITNMLEED